MRLLPRCRGLLRRETGRKALDTLSLLFGLWRATSSGDLQSDTVDGPNPEITSGYSDYPSYSVECFSHANGFTARIVGPSSVDQLRFWELEKNHENDIDHTREPCRTSICSQLKFPWPVLWKIHAIDTIYSPYCWRTKSCATCDV